MLSASPPIDLAEVEMICRRATSREAGGTGYDVHRVLASDCGTVRVHLSGAVAARLAQTALTEHGLACVATGDGWLHVMHWDNRMLRRRLGTLLASIDSLHHGWEATAELATCLYDQHDPTAIDSVPQELQTVLVGMIKAARPLPDRAPDIDEVHTLLHLIESATAAFDNLVREHLDYAQQALTLYANLLLTTEFPAARSTVRQNGRTHLTRRSAG